MHFKLSEFNLAEDPRISLIKSSGFSIYEPLDAGSPLRIPTSELERILHSNLAGLLLDQPIRTRSKVVKTAICRCLGYPVPASFRKTRPRFPGQNFDVYVQKSNNLQIWNEELDPTRRYVLIRINDQYLVENVKVVTGQQLAKLDTTGTLTKKFQAMAIAEVTNSRLVSAVDTSNLIQLMQEHNTEFFAGLKPIDKLFVELFPLIGTTFANPGADQERNRGWELHRLVSRQLGLRQPDDDGQVPDVESQLLELKLQTGPTIDLGLTSPGGQQPLDDHPEILVADLRYAIFYAAELDNKIRVDHIVVTTGADFFCFFKRLEGNVINRKNQIRLPAGFFSTHSP